MFGAALIFCLLSIFYYDYVPEGHFSKEDQKAEEAKADLKVEGVPEKAGLGMYTTKTIKFNEITSRPRFIFLFNLV